MELSRAALHGGEGVGGKAEVDDVSDAREIYRAFRCTYARDRGVTRKPRRFRLTAAGLGKETPDPKGRVFPHRHVVDVVVQAEISASPSRSRALGGRNHSLNALRAAFARSGSSLLAWSWAGSAVENADCVSSLLFFSSLLFPRSLQSLGLGLRLDDDLSPYALWCEVTLPVAGNDRMASTKVGVFGDKHREHPSVRTGQRVYQSCCELGFSCRRLLRLVCLCLLLLLFLLRMLQHPGRSESNARRPKKKQIL